MTGRSTRTLCRGKPEDRYEPAKIRQPELGQITGYRWTCPRSLLLVHGSFVVQELGASLRHLLISLTCPSRWTRSGSVFIAFPSLNTTTCLFTREPVSPGHLRVCPDSLLGCTRRHACSCPSERRECFQHWTSQDLTPSCLVCLMGNGRGLARRWCPSVPRQAKLLAVSVRYVFCCA